MNVKLNNSHFQDRAYLRHNQYKTSHNLSARAQLHQLYSSNKLGWHKWLLSFLIINGRSRVLDCSCGPGNLWKEQLTAIPADCQILLADLSDGMVREARNSVNHHNAFVGFHAADAAALPYPDRSFDVVIANHMLYHVPNRSEALQEMNRVLKRGGQFVAATNGAGHLGELRRLDYAIMPDQYAETAWMDSAFSLENGAYQLEPLFSDVELHRYLNNLLVTNPDHIVDYLLSSSGAKAASSPEKVEALRQNLARKIAADGAYPIATDSGVFVARSEG